MFAHYSGMVIVYRPGCLFHQGVPSGRITKNHCITELKKNNYTINPWWLSAPEQQAVNSAPAHLYACSISLPHGAFWSSPPHLGIINLITEKLWEKYCIIALLWDCWGMSLLKKSQIEHLRGCVEAFTKQFLLHCEYKYCCILMNEEFNLPMVKMSVGKSQHQSPEF